MNTSKVNILLVEDNMGDAHLVRIKMKDAGLKFELFHAESMRESADIIDKNHIDVVLLDLSLVDSSGFRTITNFQERYPQVAIVVLTGLDDDIVGNQAIKQGAQDYLIKGEYDGKLLGKSIRYALQRHKTQKKLEETAKNLAINEKRFIEAQQLAHFGSWEMNIVSNEMRWSDETFCIFGFTPNSFMPTLSDYINYVYAEDRNKVSDYFDQVAKDGQLHTIEHRIITPNRTVRYVQVHSKAYFEELSSKISVVGGIQDITNRVLSEQLIAEKQLNASSMQMKEEVLSDMSFHIRTPLSSIINLSFLLESTGLSSIQKEYVDALKLSIDDLSISVSNLLNFSVLHNDNLKFEEEDFKLRDVYFALHKMLKIKADTKNIKIAFETDEHIPQVLKGDANKISQILYNIIDNAIKFSNPNSIVQIQTLMKAQTDDSVSLEIRVQDIGLGMSNAKIKQILNGDLSSANDDQNKMLGLAIVSKLLKVINAELNIESREKIGSSFNISLKLKQDAASKKAVPNAPDAPLKILLVEDHFLNQIATKKVLTTWSPFVTVDIAENGMVGVEKFREYGYDIVLMDIQMPVMNGLKAAEKIRERSTVPIIALTANSSKQEAAQCAEVGMNDYLSKPFNPQELYQKIMTQMVNELSERG